MSSTNRGYDRHTTDYYITPLQCIKDFLQQWLADCPEIGNRPDKLLWCDPCAGGDATHAMSYPSVLQEELGANAITIDIRQDSRAEINADYLTYEMQEPKPDVIITNPPFYLAQEIIEKALIDVAENGYVVMLLRLNFFGSNARFPMWQKQLPVNCYVHHRRMSFTDNGKTDSIEYCHCVWQKGNYPEFTKLKII
jgi:hypothetical protein